MTMNKLSTYKTHIAVRDGHLQVTYHNTRIVELIPGINGDMITLRSGGYETVTTKRKMVQASNQFGLGYSVYQRAYDWFVRLPSGEIVPFVDGMTFAR